MIENFYFTEGSRKSKLVKGTRDEVKIQKKLVYTILTSFVMPRKRW